MPHHPGTTLKPLVQLGRAPGDCWAWLGFIDPDGNPRKQFNGESMLGRRWLWMQLFGPIPPGITIGDTCANPSCMNPAHFIARTQAEANRAGIAATLTPGDVVEIRRARKDAGPAVVGVLAEQYGISKRQVWDILGRRSWGKAGLRSKRKAA